jgi:hypothetical protein
MHDIYIEYKQIYSKMKSAKSGKYVSVKISAFLSFNFAKSKFFKAKISFYCGIFNVCVYMYNMASRVSGVVRRLLKVSL